MCNIIRLEARISKFINVHRRGTIRCRVFRRQHLDDSRRADTVEQQSQLTIRDEIQNLAPQFKAALPLHILVERFVNTVQTAVVMNPQLAHLTATPPGGAAFCTRWIAARQKRGGVRPLRREYREEWRTA